MPLARRARRVEITQAHIDAVTRLSPLGLLQGEIAKRLGISASSVARIQVRLAVPHLPRGAKSGDPVPRAHA